MVLVGVLVGVVRVVLVVGVLVVLVVLVVSFCDGLKDSDRSPICVVVVWS